MYETCYSCSTAIIFKHWIFIWHWILFYNMGYRARVMWRQQKGRIFLSGSRATFACCLPCQAKSLSSSGNQKAAPSYPSIVLSYSEMRYTSGSHWEGKSLCNLLIVSYFLSELLDIWNKRINTMKVSYCLLYLISHMFLWVVERCKEKTFLDVGVSVYGNHKYIYIPALFHGTQEATERSQKGDQIHLHTGKLWNL